MYSVFLRLFEKEEGWFLDKAVVLVALKGGCYSGTGVVLSTGISTSRPFERPAERRALSVKRYRDVWEILNKPLSRALRPILIHL